jgi:hypothetical protein
MHTLRLKPRDCAGLLAAGLGIRKDGCERMPVKSSIAEAWPGNRAKRFRAMVLARVLASEIFTRPHVLYLNICFRYARDERVTHLF